jgi:glycosyltransferase involved in cell wall biosynthesis
MTRTVYNGIDLDFYKPNPEVQRSDRYLFVGRYTPEKCPLDAIFLAKKCRVPLDLFGDTEIIGPNEAYMRKCFDETDGRQIRVNPGISREETVKQYQTHKALIHLVNYNEAFGLVPVEAQACGLPVIVNRRGALPELVRDKRSGFIVDSLEEAEEIIKKDLVLQIKPEDCVRQARKFSIQASAKGHLRALQDVANGIYW